MTKNLKAVKLSKEETKRVSDSLMKDYSIIAPVRKRGGGRFSGTDLITYDEIKSFDDIDFFEQTQISAKSVCFPVRETMFTFQGKGVLEHKENIRSIIILLRPCDINAMEIIDEHFLRDSGKSDFYYKRRRSKVKFFMIECSESFDSCYCVSLDTNKTDNYSVFMRKHGNSYEFLVREKDMEGYFPNRQDNVEEPRFVAENKRLVKISNNIDVSLFEDDLWKEYSLRCIACGRCNVSCPTCTCFSVQDIPFENETSRRRRMWSSCHVKDFSLLAGGHDFRTKYGDRMRYRALHKINDFKKRNGRHMCVGCGRCDDVCPEYISMFKCIEKINLLMQKRETNA